MSLSRPERLPLITTLWLAFALRVWRLGDKAIWWDEGLAVWAVRKPFLETTQWTAGDVHPPLFFWTLWAWMRAAGQTEFALRFITLVWGVVAVALVWALARRLGGPRAGMAAGLLAAVSPYMVEWSQELRMYMLAALAVLVAVYAALRWLDAEHAEDPRSSRRWLIAQVIGSTAALYTVYLTAVALVAINVAVGWSWLTGQRRDSSTWTSRKLLSWSAAQIITILLFLPWWLYASGRMQSWSSIQKPSSLAEVFTLAGTLLATGQSVNLIDHRAPTLVFWGMIALGLGFLVWARRSRNDDSSGDAESTFANPERAGAPGHRLPLMLLLTLLPPLAVWAATQPRSLFYAPNLEARYFVPFALPVYAAAGWIVARLADRDGSHRWLGGVLLFTMLASMMPSLSRYHVERHRVDDYASMALAIWTQYEPGDALLFTSGDRYPLFLYHYDRPWDQPAGEDPHRIPSDEDLAENNDLSSALDGSDRPVAIPFPSRAAKPLGQNDWQDRLDEIIAKHDRIWLAEVERHHQDPEGRVRARLEEAMPQVFEEAYAGGDGLFLFSEEGRTPRPTHLSESMPGIHPLEAHSPWDELGWVGLVAMPARDFEVGDWLQIGLFAKLVDTPEPAGVFVQSRMRNVSEAKTVQVWEQAAGYSIEPFIRHRIMVPVDQDIPAGQSRIEASLHGEIQKGYCSAEVNWTSTPSLGQDDFPLARTPPFEIRSGLPSTQRGERILNPNVQSGRLVLENATISAEIVDRGDRLAVDLRWCYSIHDLDPALQSRLPTIFVHAATDNGYQVGDDGPLPNDAGLTYGDVGDQADSIFDRHVLHFPNDAPPGEYTIVTGLYDAETGERWPVTSREDSDPSVSVDESARAVRLGTIRLR